MLPKLTKIAETAYLLIVSTLSYDPTVPIHIHWECVWAHCTIYGGSLSCFPNNTPACSAMSGCCYTGSAIDYDPCPAGAHVSQSADEKHYRISEVVAYNNDNSGWGQGQFQAMTVTFSPLDSSSGLPDKIYSFGTLYGEDVNLRESITISQEIIGAYFIPNVGPDYEGISFLLEDGTYLRVGLD